MKRNLLYLLPLFLLLSGCSLSSEEEPTPEKQYLLQRKLSEITFGNGRGMTIDLTYSYNNLDQLVRIAGVLLRDTAELAVHTTLAYDNQGRLAHVQNNAGTVWDNFYNDKNQLVKQVRAYKGATPFTHLHSYNAANQLVEVKTYK